MLEEVVKYPREKKIFDLVIHFSIFFSVLLRIFSLSLHFTCYQEDSFEKKANDAAKIILSDDCCRDKLCIDLLRNHGPTTFCDKQKMLLFVVILKCLSDVCGFAVAVLREIKFERQRSEKKQFHFMYAKEKIHAEKKS